MIPILFSGENGAALKDQGGADLYALGGARLHAQRNEKQDFSTHGLGTLVDCISCTVTEERNGEYELEMEYPMNGAHFDDIVVRGIVLAKPNYNDDPQAFRIYRIDTPINGAITVFAQHITYDLSGVPVLPFKAANAAAACAGLMSNAAFSVPFEIGTQLGTIADFVADAPASVRSWFGGKEGSLIDVYGGEWHYDNYRCTLKKARGEDRGVVIRYGKNLIDLDQEENISNVWTGVLPFWQDQEGGTIVRAPIVNVAGSFDFRRVLTLDLSLDFENQPTKEQLTARAKTYIEANDIGVPSVNLTVDWAQTTERVDLCDTVTVEFEKIGITAKAKCIRTVYDVLKERYSAVEFGDAKTNIVDTIAGLQDAEKKQETSVPATMIRAIQNATALITGNSGGYVILHDSDGDGAPDEILVMDTDDIATATKVWRWNKSGFGYSSSGYDGGYGTAITMDGQIVADYITTGSLSADRISGGTITGVAFNNGSGTFEVDESGNVTANSFNSSKAVITGGYLDLITENISQGITLKNSAGSTYTQHSASQRRRYVNGSLVLSELNGALTVVSVTQTSDERLKDVAGEGSPDLSAVRAKRFRWKDNRDDGEHIGYIAQEVEEIAPEMVGEVDGFKTLDYIQVLVAKVDRLERENEELKARVNALEGRL